jgi:hypothetical protein
MRFFKFLKDLLFKDTKNSKPEVSTPLVDKVVIEKNEVPKEGSSLKINGNEQLPYKREMHFPNSEKNQMKANIDRLDTEDKKVLSEKTKVEEPNTDLKSSSKTEILKKDKGNTEIKNEKVKLVQDPTKSDKPKPKRKRPYKSKKTKQDPKQGE